MRDAAVALARIGVGGADGEHRAPTERARDVGGLGERERAVAEPRPCADDAGADRADHRVVALLLRPGERRRNGDELRVAVEARRDGAGNLDEPALLQRPHGVRERDRQRATCDLHVRHAQLRRAPAQTGATWLWSVHRTTGSPSSASGELVRLLLVTDCYLARRVRKRHHVRPLLGLEPEPARQVRVEDVEAARSELEQPRLLVHEHLVPHLDLAGEPRVGDARDAVDLEPDETREPLRAPPRRRLV